MNRTHRFLILVSALLLAGAAGFAPRMFNPLEAQITSLKYMVRGERSADSSIVLVYIDDEAARTLGWPVRRNFYALMVKALHELHAGAIGIEVVFEDQTLDFPEYDDLLASVVGAAGNVVLPSYFGAVATPDAASGKSGFSSIDYPNVRSVCWTGSNFHLPFARLARASAGNGHVNFGSEDEIPLFIRSDSVSVACFGLEVLRTALGAGREGVRFDGERVTINGSGGSAEFSAGDEGTVLLDLPGRVSSFRAFPFLEVLKSYDALRSEREGSVPVGLFKGKVVLVGVMAEGRSQFFRTPVDDRFSSLALHATFIDNALGGRFVRSLPGWVIGILAFVLGAAVGHAVLGLRSPLNWVIPIAELIVAGAVSYLLFSTAAMHLPVLPLIVPAVILAFQGAILRQREAKRHVDALRIEKDSVLKELRDREAKLLLLERELLSAQEARANDRTSDLLEEIRRYKEEIRTLSSRAGDMEAYRSPENGGERQPDEFDGIIYDRAGSMREVVGFVAKIATSDAPVLVLGESGTGKELVARSIHTRSKRAEGPFIPVNCGALTETLLESELFGHEKGSFTGAVKERIGRFELASGGTIFLDEIGEVSENFQVKLLRVLQEGEIERVGGTKTIRVDVRVVAATNRDLREQVRAGKFREDLFYRLNVLTVNLPPLRERREDVPILIDHFLAREGSELSISKMAAEALRSYDWPGNVRELESALRRAILLARADSRGMIAVKDLTEEIAAAGRQAFAVEDQILDSLREKKFSRSAVSETASELGRLNRGTVAEYLRGECLKAFVESGFDVEKAARVISLSVDPGVVERVQKRIHEYLQNLVEAIDRSQPWENTKEGLRPKMKNLPQRYHTHLASAAEAYYRGIWKQAS